MSKMDSDELNTTFKEQDAAENDELDMYVKFSKPYTFEDDVYDGIDLSGLSKLNGRNINNIEKKFYKLSIPSFNPENTAAYAQIVAQEATGFPIEFFQQLPIKEMYKIKSRVVNFFYS